MIRVRRIALPTEHGGWGFLLEPLAAGLIVAFSLGGFFIALMFIGAFLVRQPFKVLIINWMGMRDPRQANVAIKYVLLYSSIAIAGTVGALFTANISSLIPLLCVLPLLAVQNFYDIFRRSRNLIPELAGVVAVSSSVAAITLAGGFSWGTAIALWAVFVSGLIPSILYVRQRLLLEKGKHYSQNIPVIAHIAAVNISILLLYFGEVSILTLSVMLLLAYRAIIGLSPERKKMKAMQIGIWEVVYGTLLTASVAAGHFLGV